MHFINIPVVHRVWSTWENLIYKCLSLFFSNIVIQYGSIYKTSFIFNTFIFTYCIISFNILSSTDPKISCFFSQKKRNMDTFWSRIPYAIYVAKWLQKENWGKLIYALDICILNSNTLPNVCGGEMFKSTRTSSYKTNSASRIVSYVRYLLSLAGIQLRARLWYEQRGS